MDPAMPFIDEWSGPLQQMYAVKHDAGFQPCQLLSTMPVHGMIGLTSCEFLKLRWVGLS